MTLRMRVLPRFPATITATNGLVVERPTGTPNLIVKPDFGPLVQIPSVGNGDEVFFMAWDRENALYRKISFNDLFEGISDLGFMTAGVYDPNGHAADAFARANHTGTQAQSTVVNLVSDLAAKEGKVVYASKSGNYTAVAADNNAVHRYTANATVSLTAAATLGANWHYTVDADGGDVIIDPNGSETIDGATTLNVTNGTSALIICDGSNFFCVFKEPTWREIENRVVTSQSTVSFTGLSAYRSIRITGILKPSSAAAINIRSSSNNGSSYDSGATDYSTLLSGATSSGGGTALNSFTQASQINLTNTNAVTYLTLNGVVWEDFNKAATGLLGGLVRYSTAGVAVAVQLGSSRDQATARNAFQIISGAAMSGSLLIEGIRG